MNCPACATGQLSVDDQTMILVPLHTGYHIVSRGLLEVVPRTFAVAGCNECEFVHLILPEAK